MKHTRIFLTVFILCLTLVNFSQISKQPETKGNSETDVNLNSAKENYIKEKGYFSANSSKAFKNFYGDSLRGFDEEKIRVELLNHGVYGEEYQLYIKTLKRDYINKKYKLPAATPATLPASTAPSNAKPIGGSNSVNNIPCVNEDFESSTAGQYTTANAITGWTISSQVANSCITNPVWTPGSSKFWIRQTPLTGIPSLTNLGNSPFGGSLVAQLNDNVPPLSLRTKIATTFPVTLNNTLFQFAYAGVWEDGGHNCCEQPALKVALYDCTGTLLSCSSVSLNAQGPSCPNGSTGYTVTNGTSWTNWQVKPIDLTPYIGTCVTIEIINSDCIFGGHYGMTFIDAQCGGQLLGSISTSTGGTISASPVSYCAGSNIAQIIAPLGYASYQWYAPGMIPIAAPTGTSSILTVTNPAQGAIYTVDLTTSSGCIFTSTNVLSTSTVNIAGLGSSPSCPGGASGTATVVGNGSGSGYNYLWTNASNSVVGTNSIATGLAAGVYSIQISGLGSAGCGTAVSTVTVGTAQPAVINLLKPFCGSSPAYLNTNGGSGFQWYGSTGAISATLGGTAQNYTVTSPSSGSVVILTYTSSVGCRDSVRFTLTATPPGFVAASNIGLICPGASNGTAQITIAMAPGAPPGSTSTTITSTGTASPSYSFMSYSPSFICGALSAGTYSVNAFDGSCYYSTSFSVVPYVFDYTLTPKSPTLCPGNSIASAVNFSVPVSLTQYSYSWTPSTFLAGNNAQSTILSPTIAVGTQSTIVYTVVVTPSLVNCPITKTLSIKVINPAIPTFTTIPALCNNSGPYQILTSIPGGTFSTAFPGTNSPVNQLNGVITPSNSNITFGINTFTYAISINTCIAKGTATYEVSKFWTAALSSSVPPLCVTNSPFNLMTIVQNTVNGSWSGQGVSSNLFNPSTLNTSGYPLTYSCFSYPNPNACPSSTTIIANVTKTITPLITPVPEFCTNATAFNMTVSPSGGSWQVVNGLNTTGNVTPGSITVSSLTTNYSVTVGPCINTASSNLFISKFNTAAFSGIVPHLCYNSPAFNLMSIVQSTVNGQWTGMNGVSSNSFISSGLASNIYIATYNTSSSPNATLCPDSKTIAISVLNPPTPSISPVAPLCNNANSFQLNALPLDGHWVSSSYLNSSGIFTPSLSAVGNNAIQYETGTNTCNVVQSINVPVEAFVPATIISNISDLCTNNNPLNLTPITLNNNGTWSGTGIVGNNFNPALSSAGTFTLTYSTASIPSGLCPDMAQTTVKVFSLAAPAISKIGPFCNNGMPVQIEVSPVGGLFGGANIGVINTSGLFHPANALIGNNLINYSITSGPCVAYAQTTVTIEKFVSADFEKQVGPFCKTAFAVNMNSFVRNPDGLWTGQGMQGNMFDPSLAKPDNSNIVQYTTYSFPSGKLCPDTSSIRIEVRDLPKVSAQVSNESGCAPLEVIFNSPNVNIGKGVWHIGDGKEKYEGLDHVHLFTSAGTYTAVFEYEDELGCKALPAYAKPVVIHETPTADFNIPEEINISDAKVKAINSTSELMNNKYEWKSSASEEIKTDVNPIFEFTKAGKYNIKLTSYSMYNCKSEVNKSILVKNNFNVYIPNSFSPNFDNLNDVFIPVFSPNGLDERNYELEIFDRWGHSLFYTKDPHKGWDGTAKGSSDIVTPGVYLYKIKYKDLEGNSYNKSGNINLVQ